MGKLAGSDWALYRWRATGLRRATVAVVAASLLLAPIGPGARGEPGMTPPGQSAAAPVAQGSDTKSPTMSDLSPFLDRLMLAESAGRDDARNPRSTAVGPFQFIERTFLDLIARYFSVETRQLDRAGQLALRADRAFARKVAEAYTRENAAALADADLAPTFANLRLAFFAGADGAIRVLKAPPGTSAQAILGGAVVRANPFLAGMTVAHLAQWSARTMALDGRISVPEAGRARAGARSGAGRPAITVHCNPRLASCRRWVSLAKQRSEGPRVVGAATRGGRR